MVLFNRENSPACPAILKVSLSPSDTGLWVFSAGFLSLHTSFKLHILVSYQNNLQAWKSAMSCEGHWNLGDGEFIPKYVASV